MNKMLYALVVFFMMSSSLSAQEITITIDRDTVYADNELEVSYTFTDLNTTSFEVIPLIDWTLVGGPNVMSSHRVVNGDSSSKTVYTYRYFIEEPGIYTIPSVTVADVKSEELIVEVLDNPENIKQSITSSSGGNSMFSTESFDINLNDMFKRRRRQIDQAKPQQKSKRPLKKF